MFKIRFILVLIVLASSLLTACKLEEECLFFPPTYDSRTGLPVPGFEICGEVIEATTPVCEYPYVCYNGVCSHLECTAKFGCYKAFECQINR